MRTHEGWGAGEVGSAAPLPSHFAQRVVPPRDGDHMLQACIGHVFCITQIVGLSGILKAHGRSYLPWVGMAMLALALAAPRGGRLTGSVRS